MPNLVEITIKADDESGGAFASVLARYYAMKNAMKDGIVIGAADAGNITSSLVSIKQKVQAIGLADIADVNVQPGILYQRLYYIKRAMQQVGLGDIFGIGASPLLKVAGDLRTLGFGGPLAPMSNNFIGGSGGGEGGGGGVVGAVGGDGGKGGGIGAAIGGMLGGLAGMSLGFGLLTKIGGVAGWHILTDLVIEGLISIGTAAIAGAAGVAVMAATLGNIHDHLTAVNDVSKALGQNIAPLNSRFQALSKAMAPQTIELYGAGVNILNTAMSRMGPGVSNIVNLFDTWAAKTVNWIQSQNTFGNIMRTGSSYLAQFGTLIGTLAQALGNLLTKDPGIAHYLIDILQGVANLVNWFSRLPGPVVETTLAIHGLYLWTKVLGGLLGMFAGNLIRVSTGFITLAGSMYGVPALIIAIAAAMAILALQLNKGTPLVQAFINSWTSQLGQEKASQFIYDNVAALGAMDQMLHTVNQTFESSQFNKMNAWHQALTGAGALGHYFAEWAKGLGTLNFHNAVEGIRAVFDIAAGGTAGGGFITKLLTQEDVNRLKGMVDQILGSERNLFHETGRLMTQGFTFSQALGLMDLAGVKQSDTFEVMRTKVHDLIVGYQNMSVQGGVLANSVNAVTFQTMLQDSHVQALQQGWQSFYQTVTGGLSGYLSVAQAFNTLQQGLASGGGLTGLSQASVTNQQNVLATVAAIQQEQSAMLQQLAAANLGKKGTDMLTQATQAYLQQLLKVIPVTNSEFLPALNAIAQQGGLPAAKSMQALAKELGVPLTNPMATAAGITNTLDTKVQNLNTDVQNLSTALGTTLTNAMHTAIFMAAGGQKPFTNFASAVMAAHGNTKLLYGSAGTLIGTLKKLDPSHAKQLFFDFAQMLGLTKSQAQALWQHDLPNLQKAIDNMHGKTISLNVVTNYSSTGGSPLVPGGSTYNSQVPPHGYGGIAAATGGPRGGLVTVGEYGKELIQLPSGSHVLPHSNQAAQMAAMGGGNVHIVLSVDPSFRNLGLSSQQIAAIRATVVSKGGGGPNSVQKAFGQTW